MPVKVSVPGADLLNLHNNYAFKLDHEGIAVSGHRISGLLGRGSRMTVLQPEPARKIRVNNFHFFDHHALDARQHCA